MWCTARVSLVHRHSLRSEVLKPSAWVSSASFLDLPNKTEFLTPAEVKTRARPDQPRPRRCDCGCHNCPSGIAAPTRYEALGIRRDLWRNSQRACGFPFFLVVSRWLRLQVIAGPLTIFHHSSRRRRVRQQTLSLPCVRTLRFRKYPCHTCEANNYVWDLGITELLPKVARVEYSSVTSWVLTFQGQVRQVSSKID